MSSFFAKLLGSPTKPPAKPPAKPAAAAPRKSAARAADERNILEARRAILANMARIEQNPSAKQKVIDLIDRDADRASEVVRAILQSQGKD
jgi:hypothetical protein